MVIRNYQDLEVWQKSMEPVVECYRSTKSLPKAEAYGLVNQMRRAAISVPANIAEGRARQYIKEFVQHLSIAYGSLAELETYLQIGERLDYLDRKRFKELMGSTGEIGRMLNGLRKSLKKVDT